MPINTSQLKLLLSFLYFNLKNSLPLQTVGIHVAVLSCAATIGSLFYEAPSECCVYNVNSVANVKRPPACCYHMSLEWQNEKAQRVGGGLRMLWHAGPVSLKRALCRPHAVCDCDAPRVTCLKGFKEWKA